MNVKPILMPQFGVNDISATIVAWTKDNGSKVRRGETLCTAETTKSTFDIESEHDGYLTILRKVEEIVRIGDLLGVISERALRYEEAEKWMTSFRAKRDSATGQTQKKISEKARLLALKNKIDINMIETKSGRITESDVIAHIKKTESDLLPSELQDSVDDLLPHNEIQRLLIIGAGRGVIQIIDAISRTPAQRAVILLDDTKSLHGKIVAGAPVIGDISYDLIESMFREGKFDAAVISISTSVPFRARVFRNLRSRGIPFCNIIHPTAYVGTNVSVGVGNVILPFCHIGPCTTIGNNNFLSAYCSIEHHNVLESHCSFGPAVITSSNVQIRDEVRFGMGVFIEPYVTIEKNALIGSGCVIWKDVPENTTAKPKLNYSLRPRIHVGAE